MLEINNLTKSFRTDGSGPKDKDAFAVDRLSLTVKAGEFFTLLGPSGCGKTTTLRCIAGLEEPSDGTIAIDGKVIFSGSPRVHVPPNERGLGMVFQSYAIWPHLSVYKNAAFPLDAAPAARRLDAAARRNRVMEVLTTMQLAAMADRPATALSGGQQQRLALARALVGQPRLLLLDEPLSNLDAKLRDLLRFELKRLQRELGITLIYVTHDQGEALAMSDTIAVLNQGRLEQLGTPREIYDKPRTKFVADFIGDSNFIDGVVDSVSKDADGTQRCDVTTPMGRFPGIASGEPVSQGEKLAIAVRPHHILFGSEHAGKVGGPGLEVGGVIDALAFNGDYVDCLVKVSGVTLRMRTEAASSATTSQPVRLFMPSAKARLVR